MKKLINTASAVLDDALRGLAAAEPSLRVDRQGRVVYRAHPKDPGKVALVSGGGSGHEPLHSGFVGTGMLDAACVGEVFTSPTADQISAATAEVDSGAGVVHIVKNYTGDVLNFEMAEEMSSARIERVVVADDVSVTDSTFTAGRRGIGATMLVEKLAGAAAEEGRPLTQVAAVARHAARSCRSMGLALTSCTVPAVGHPTFVLPDDEIEVGVGIHGEPGHHREPLMMASQAAETLVDAILDDLDFTAGPVVALLSGLGGTPLLEQYLVYGEISGVLDRAGVTVARCLVGDYITSLDMAGCSLTLMRCDEDMLRLWDAPVATVGLRWGL